MRTPLGIALISIFTTTHVALSKDIAICGASEGYSYYALGRYSEALGDQDAGKWQEEDGTAQGRVTLSYEGEKFELLFTDPSGEVVSATSDGATITLVGQNDEAVSLIVDYPRKSVETWTFVKTRNGPEALRSVNMYGTTLPKVGAYRASCSLLNLKK